VNFARPTRPFFGKIGGLSKEQKTTTPSYLSLLNGSTIIFATIIAYSPTGHPMADYNSKKRKKYFEIL
jgi:hypothetical protein